MLEDIEPGGDYADIIITRRHRFEFVVTVGVAGRRSLFAASVPDCDLGIDNQTAQLVGDGPFDRAIVLLRGSSGDAGD